MRTSETEFMKKVNTFFTIKFTTALFNMVAAIMQLLINTNVYLTILTYINLYLVYGPEPNPSFHLSAPSLRFSVWINN